MKHKMFFVIFGLIVLTNSLLAGVKYPVSEISEALKKMQRQWCAMMRMSL